MDERFYGDDYCPDCGQTWGGYTPTQQQHYCIGGARKFRAMPLHSDREAVERARRDPYEARRQDQEAWYKRMRYGG